MLHYSFSSSHVCFEDVGKLPAMSKCLANYFHRGACAGKLGFSNDCLVLPYSWLMKCWVVQPVHKWMVRHIYFPSIRAGLPKVLYLILHGLCKRHSRGNSLGLHEYGLSFLRSVEENYVFCLAY